MACNVTNSSMVGWQHCWWDNKQHNNSSILRHSGRFYWRLEGRFYPLTTYHAHARVGGFGGIVTARAAASVFLAQTHFAVNAHAHLLRSPAACGDARSGMRGAAPSPYRALGAARRSAAAHGPALKNKNRHRLVAAPSPLLSISSSSSILLLLIYHHSTHMAAHTLHILCMHCTQACLLLQW